MFPQTTFWGNFWLYEVKKIRVFGDLRNDSEVLNKGIEEYIALKNFQIL